MELREHLSAPLDNSISIDTRKDRWLLDCTEVQRRRRIRQHPAATVRPLLLSFDRSK